VLGTDKNDRARSRFDGAHELGHFVVHGDQIWGVKEVEHQAHAFAAAFLMPAGDIRDELPDRADWTVLSLPQDSCLPAVDSRPSPSSRIPAKSCGGLGSPIGSLTGSQPTPSFSHTRRH
jgi:hypothetical protein